MTGSIENRLRDAASPYLRSAAPQLIDWYQCGEEAFEKARADQKPVLLATVLPARPMMQVIVPGTALPKSLN